jgi:hypothetical protein
MRVWISTVNSIFKLAKVFQAMQAGYTRIDEDTSSYEENGDTHFAKLCDAGKEKRLSV